MANVSRHEATLAAMEPGRPTTARELAEALDITAGSVRLHMRVLEGLGHVKDDGFHEMPGKLRPTKHWVRVGKIRA